jgi:hypothetical protein
MGKKQVKPYLFKVPKGPLFKAALPPLIKR